MSQAQAIPGRFLQPSHLIYGLLGAHSAIFPRIMHTSDICCRVYEAYVAYLIIHRLFLWPYLLSPLRKIPGPPLGNPILGQSPTIIKSESGIPQREWVKQYGPVVRVVGPIGIERIIFTKPEALHQILVTDWVDYPRVSSSHLSWFTR